MRIGELISKASELPWDSVVFCSNLDQLLDSDFILVPQESILSEAVSEEITFDGNDGTWQDLCLVSDLQDVVINLGQQVFEPSQELAVRALMHYLAFDAFMSVDRA